jgi:hypothetical protein
VSDARHGRPVVARYTVRDLTSGMVPGCGARRMFQERRRHTCKHPRRVTSLFETVPRCNRKSGAELAEWA